MRTAIGIALLATLCFVPGYAQALPQPPPSPPAVPFSALKCKGSPAEVMTCLQKDWTNASNHLADVKGHWDTIWATLPHPDTRFTKCFAEGGGKLQKTLEKFSKNPGEALAGVMRELLQGKGADALKNPWLSGPQQDMNLRKFVHLVWSQMEKEGESQPWLKCAIRVAGPDWKKLDPTLDSIDNGAKKQTKWVHDLAENGMRHFTQQTIGVVLKDFNHQAQAAHNAFVAKKPRSPSDELYELAQFARTAASRRMISAERAKTYGAGVDVLTGALEKGAQQSDYQAAITVLTNDIKVDETILAGVIVDIVKFEVRRRVRQEGAQALDWALRGLKTSVGNYTNEALHTGCGVVDSMNLSLCSVYGVGSEGFWDLVVTPAIRQGALAAADIAMDLAAPILEKELVKALKAGSANSTVEGVNLGAEAMKDLTLAANLLLSDLPSSINDYNHSVRRLVKAQAAAH